MSLVLRLRGGKGGFGALLRGLGRDGSKTTNNDAMRDLQVSNPACFARTLAVHGRTELPQRSLLLEAGFS